MSEQIEKKEGLLIILSGASGVGKDEVLKGILKQGLPLKRVVTYCADKGPRPGEIEGNDYHFISKEKFYTMVDKGEFFEYNIKPGQMKGTGRGDVESVRNGENVIWRIDPDRASKIKNDLPEKGFEDLVPKTRTIYLGVPTIRELWRRINTRESNESREKRLERLKFDWEVWTEKNSVFDVMIINESGKLDKTIENVTEFIRREINDVATS